MPASDIRITESLHKVLVKRLGETEAQAALSEVVADYLDNHTLVPNVNRLHDAISACRSCDNAKAAPQHGWWNWQSGDLILVTSNVYTDDRYTGALGMMLKQTKFSSAFVGGINVTKCSFESVTTENVKNCSHWLYDQIDIARPKVIAPIGAQAFEFFKTNQKNYTSAIGTSWWWGIYKIYALPSFKDLGEESWLEIFSNIYNYIYGSQIDVIDATQ